MAKIMLIMLAVTALAGAVSPPRSPPLLIDSQPSPITVDAAG